MSIVFGAITPHPPFLIPEIGKNQSKKLKKTLLSLERLEHDLYASVPDTLIIMSPHSKAITEAHSINLCANYTGTFEQFGDMSTKLHFKADVCSIQEIRAQAETEKTFSLILSSDENIDYGISIPYYFLARHLPKLQVIPLYPSTKSLVEHYEFGRFIRRAISKINKRFAIIASGDMSHRLSKSSPGGYSKNAVAFDKKIIQSLKESQIKEFLLTPQAEREDALECSLRVTSMLLGIMHGTKHHIEILSYESPFGVGYLTAQVMLG